MLQEMTKEQVSATNRQVIQVRDIWLDDVEPLPNTGTTAWPAFVEVPPYRIANVWVNYSGTTFSPPNAVLTALIDEALRVTRNEWFIAGRGHSTASPVSTEDETDSHASDNVIRLSERDSLLVAEALINSQPPSDLLREAVERYRAFMAAQE